MQRHRLINLAFHQVAKAIKLLAGSRLRSSGSCLPNSRGDSSNITYPAFADPIGELTESVDAAHKLQRALCPRWRCDGYRPAQRQSEAHHAHTVLAVRQDTAISAGGAANLRRGMARRGCSRRGLGV
jgi:hypothetical protein